ncbi:MAG: nucleoside-diphosphate kinase [Candidatus Diapherotrites archaeon]|nr:nucleoside-diphosphate kinase [Candidatus Diapherotrites archaeon]
MERTLVIIKPDAVNRNLIGEVLHRFERKGVKIVGMKMVHLDDKILEEHYAHHKGKSFFPKLKEFMKKAPSIVLVLEGNEIIEVVRKFAGVTKGTEALPGTIRGDFSLSVQANIIHASDSKEAAQAEIKRFFSDKEIFSYPKIDSTYVYAEDELKA